MKRAIKLSVIMSALLASCLSASATINVQWRASNGLYDPATSGADANLPRGSCVELYYTPASNYANAVLLAREYTTLTGCFNFGPREFGTGTDYEGGYLFVKVYNSATPTWRNAVLISSFADMSVSPLPDASTPVTVDVANLNLMALAWRRNFAAGNNARGDYDGDGLMDIIVYNQTTGYWLVCLSGSGYQTISGIFGGPGYIPAPGDYDGDRVTELVVYEEATGYWYNHTFGGVNAQLGGPECGPDCRPVQGDYDGDGKTDPACYSETNGHWHFSASSNQYAFFELEFGGPGYKSVAADYDGDGINDPVLYQENGGVWDGLLSSHGYAEISAAFGAPGMSAVPGDYDGDGLADPALYQEASGTWVAALSGDNYGTTVATGFGGAGFTPAPADYDGDGLCDPAVYQTSTGMWLAALSAHNYVVANIAVGGSGYMPVR